jgi:hypothetical protein
MFNYLYMKNRERIFFKVNTRFGFGLLNAAALTEAGKNWITVPEKSICEIEPIQFEEQYVKQNEI